MDTRIRAREKRTALARWIGAWYYTDLAIAARVLGTAKSGASMTVRQLVDAGVLAWHALPDLRVPILHITRAGWPRIRALLDDDHLRPPTTGAGVERMGAHRHHLIAQHCVLDLRAAGTAQHIYAPAQIASQNWYAHAGNTTAGYRYPDAAVVAPDGGRIAIEMQLSRIRDEHMRQRLSTYGAAIESGTGYAGVIWASPRPEICQQITRLRDAQPDAYEYDHARRCYTRMSQWKRPSMAGVRVARLDPTLCARYWWVPQTGRRNVSAADGLF